MKSLRRIIFISFIFTGLSISGAISSFVWLENFYFSPLITNICIGLFTGALVSFATFFNSYIIARRDMLLQFYQKSMEMTYQFAKIKYVYFGEDKQLLAEYWNEKWKNEMIIDFNYQLNKYGNKNIMKTSYENRFKMLSNIQLKLLKSNHNLSNEELESRSEIELKEENIRYKNSIREAIETYIEVSEISTDMIDKAWKEICCLFNKKKRIVIYQNIYRKQHDSIMNIKERKHFLLENKNVKNAKDLAFVANCIFELQDYFFESETIINSSNSMLRSRNIVFDDLHNSLNNFWADIHREKKDPYKKNWSWGIVVSEDKA